MKTLIVSLSAILVSSLAANSVPASTAVVSSQPKAIIVETPGAISGASTMTTTATVQKIDKKTRAITLKTETGEAVTIAAPKEVRNFAQIKIGDIVTTKISNTIDIRVIQSASTEVGYAVQETSSRANLGEKPRGSATRTVAIRAKVTKVDPKTRMVTIEGQRQISEIQIQNAEHFNTIHVGDIIDALITESIAISVTPAKKK